MKGGTIEKFAYQVGLSRQHEAVISSHFMAAIAGDATLQPYDAPTLERRALVIPHATIDEVLLPVLLAASRAFAVERATAAVDRAARHIQDYGISDPRELTEADVLAEAMFDRQFSRRSEATCSRRRVRDAIRARLEYERCLTLVIPSLPFKIASPLKARGTLPDLAEVGFLLSLFEIACTLEAVAARINPAAPRLDAKFVVVSDGSRFAALANVASATIARYRAALETWIHRLGIARQVEIVDYRELLERSLPTAILRRKRRLADEARKVYADILDPIYDADAMEHALARTRDLEPDPENGNAAGRFASLFKSLVFTINYRALDKLDLPSGSRYDLYRELTGNLLVPYDGASMVPGMVLRKEHVRRAMLAEAWQATIDYLAEIKSDRELPEDPILTCLPTALRWTIHAKAGQFAIAAPSVQGVIVQPWAGSAVFRKTTKGTIRLCTYPALGLEGHDAIPVLNPTYDQLDGQPLFYVDRSIDITSILAFLEALAECIDRRKIS